MTFVTFLTAIRHGLESDTAQAYVHMCQMFRDSQKARFPGCKQLNRQILSAFLCRDGGAR